MKKSKIAVLKTKSETVPKSYTRLMKLTGIHKTLPKDSATNLKDNISLHLPIPTTTPWQFYSTITTLKNLRYKDIVAVEKKAVATKSKLSDSPTWVLLKNIAIQTVVIPSSGCSGTYD